MSDIHLIRDAITQYAAAYGRLQALQKSSALLPMGDQKTGCIGEFYVQLYLRGKFPGSLFSMGSHSEKGWDLLVQSSERTWRVQTKTVSAYSTTRRLSPIHEGWDELFIMYLDERFYPQGFWVISDNSIVAGGKCVRHCSCPHPSGRNAGSRALSFGPNRIEEFMRVVRPQLEA